MAMVTLISHWSKRGLELFGDLHNGFIGWDRRE